MQLASKIGFMSRVKSTGRVAAGGSELTCSGVSLAVARSTAITPKKSVSTMLNLFTGRKEPSVS
jgi:hypothetical protein